MDDWQDEWMKTLETVANDIGQFFQDVGKGMEETVDALIELTDEMAEEVERAVSPGLNQLDRQIDEWIDPILFALSGLGSSIDQAVEPMAHTVEPMLNQHPVCVGCRHYHGQSYNGVMFVCAMHPYGMMDDADTCPDKEAITWSLPAARFFDELDDRNSSN
ncbi:hypothetical protein C7B76_22035 [filamentous cyanobacterium CCP2]|nr:hypothetical protein C7B76_22035 [filamentous cyanobacterium CCP2]